MMASPPRDTIKCHVRRRRNRAERDRLPLLRPALSRPRGKTPDDRFLETGRGGGGHRPRGALAVGVVWRWGLRGMYVGNVGDDEHGRLSLFLLREEGIDLSRARTVPGAVSQFAVILVQGDSGERTILWERDARLRIRPGDIPREEIRRSRAVFIDGHDVPASLESARVARGAGVPVVLDAEKVQEGTEELLGLCDHIVAASSFVAHLFP